MSTIIVFARVGRLCDGALPFPTSSMPPDLCRICRTFSTLLQLTDGVPVTTRAGWRIWPGYAPGAPQSKRPDKPLLVRQTNALVQHLPTQLPPRRPQSACVSSALLRRDQRSEVVSRPSTRSPPLRPFVLGRRCSPARKRRNEIITLQTRWRARFPRACWFSNTLSSQIAFPVVRAVKADWAFPIREAGRHPTRGVQRRRFDVDAVHFSPGASI